MEDDECMYRDCLMGGLVQSYLVIWQVGHLCCYFCNIMTSGACLCLSPRLRKFKCWNMSPTLEGVSLSGDHKSGRGRRGRDSMVVGFTTNYAISAYHTKVVNSNPVHGEVYSIQHYVIKFVSDLRQVRGFLRVHQFPPPIKLTATI